MQTNSVHVLRWYFISWYFISCNFVVFIIPQCNQLYSWYFISYSVCVHAYTSTDNALVCACYYYSLLYACIRSAAPLLPSLDCWMRSECPTIAQNQNKTKTTNDELWCSHARSLRVSGFILKIKTKQHNARRLKFSNARQSKFAFFAAWKCRKSISVLWISVNLKYTKCIISFIFSTTWICPMKFKFQNIISHFIFK